MTARQQFTPTTHKRGRTETGQAADPHRDLRQSVAVQAQLPQVAEAREAVGKVLNRVVRHVQAAKSGQALDWLNPGACQTVKGRLGSQRLMICWMLWLSLPLCSRSGPCNLRGNRKAVPAPTPSPLCYAPFKPPLLPPFFPFPSPIKKKTPHTNKHNNKKPYRSASCG